MYSESKPDCGDIDLIGCFAPDLPQAAHASICSTVNSIRTNWCRTDQRHSKVLIAADVVSAVPGCSLGSPGQGWGSCGWSLLTWHCMLRPCLVWDESSNALADEETASWWGRNEGTNYFLFAAKNWTRADYCVGNFSAWRCFTLSCSTLSQWGIYLLIDW